MIRAANGPQLDLELSPSRPATIQERFEAWLFENPHVWRLFKRFAYEALDSGRDRFGVAMIVERMRWYTTIESRGEDFKINNSFRSRLVRKLVDEDPRFEDFFEQRTLRSP